MAYQISGLDQEKALWMVRAESKATAEHIATMFRKEGYEKVTVKELPDA
jgi:hypothetical protein